MALNVRKRMRFVGSKEERMCVRPGMALLVTPPGEAWLWLSAVRRVYGSLQLWMKSINHPHSRDQKRKVFPVPPTLKYGALGSLLQRGIPLEELNGIIF